MVVAGWYSVASNRSAVRIQSSANFYMEHLFSVNCIDKTKIKKKRPLWATKFAFTWRRQCLLLAMWSMSRLMVTLCDVSCFAFYFMMTSSSYCIWRCVMPLYDKVCHCKTYANAVMLCDVVKCMWCYYCSNKCDVMCDAIVLLRFMSWKLLTIVTSVTIVTFVTIWTSVTIVTFMTIWTSVTIVTFKTLVSLGRFWRLW